MNRRYLLLAPLVAAQVLVGCAATSPADARDRYVSSQFVPPPSGSLLLLLHIPANQASYRSRDLDVLKNVQEELIKRGYTVALIEPEDYRLALRAELQQLRPANETPSRSPLSDPAFLQQGVGIALSPLIG